MEGYEYEIALYSEYKCILREALKAIGTKFPLMLADVKSPNCQYRPANYTPAMASKYILDQLMDPQQAQDLFVSIQQKLPALKYIPTSIGPKEYFHDIVDLLFQARRLTQAGTVNLRSLTTYALQAFLRCGHDTTTLTKLEGEWILKETALLAAHKTAQQQALAKAIQTRDDLVAAAEIEEARRAIPLVHMSTTEKDLIPDFMRYWTRALAKFYINVLKY